MENNKDITPIFYSHASGKSILTGWKESECVEGGPTSIIKLVKQAGLKKFIYVGSSFHDYVEILKNSEAAGLQMIFGLEILMCPNSEEKTDEAIKSNHKIIVFQKNSEGYKDLVKLYSKWKTNISNKYYEFRFDYKQLRECWTPNLSLALPFFNSFLAANTLQYNCIIIPDLPTEEVVLFREVGLVHPHKDLIDFAVDEFNKEGKYEELAVKSIFYEKREDSKPWIVYKAIQSRGNFSAPKLEYLASDDFCWESYMELTKKAWI